MVTEIFLDVSKLFHFHGIFRKMRSNQQSDPPPRTFIYVPLFPEILDPPLEADSKERQPQNPEFRNNTHVNATSLFPSFTIASHKLAYILFMLPPDMFAHDLKLIFKTCIVGNQRNRLNQMRPHNICFN